MQDKVLKRDEYQSWLNKLTETLANEQAEVEVASLNLGDQIVAEWVPVLGVTYDPKDDVLSVALKNYDHLIRKPQSITVIFEGADVKSLVTTDSEGTEHIVRFREPLALPGA